MTLATASYQARVFVHMLGVYGYNAGCVWVQGTGRESNTDCTRMRVPSLQAQLDEAL